MSKCRPNKKKIARRIRNELKKKLEAAELSDASHISELSVALNNVNFLQRRVDEFRLALRELGDEHSLKYQKSADSGTLINCVTVPADTIDLKGSGRTKDDVERRLVERLAYELVNRGLVRIEKAEYPSENDMRYGTVTYTGRIDVIPWYKIVKPEIRMCGDVGFLKRCRPDFMEEE